MGVGAIAKVKGTGLGLFIARSIVRQHGGDISAQSYGEGRGTTMTLHFPLLPHPTYPQESEVHA